MAISISGKILKQDLAAYILLQDFPEKLLYIPIIAIIPLSA
jgi:hypothetical protein